MLRVVVFTDNSLTPTASVVVLHVKSFHHIFNENKILDCWIHIQPLVVENSFEREISQALVSHRMIEEKKLLVALTTA